RGRARGGSGCHRERAGRRGRADDHAATDPGTGVAADTGSTDQLKPGGKQMSVPKVAAVIGAGTMGPGMAAVLARAGSEVRLYDISDEVLERAKGGYQLATGALDWAEAVSAPGGSVGFCRDLRL